MVLSARILISSSLRRSPRLISTTSPLTGAQYITEFIFLSKRMGEPAFTVSPSFTVTLGRISPGKSMGLRAKVSERGASASCRTGLPTKLMVKPFLSLMCSGINASYKCYKTLQK